MAMSKKMVAALTKQAGAEWYSAYLYLQMAAWFEDRSLLGFGAWLRVQAQEETCHGLIFFNHLIERDMPVVLPAIDAPKHDFSSPSDVFAEVLKHEELVTSLIHKLADLAREENDHATRRMLDWFVDEQVEEEANSREMLDKLKLLGENSGEGLLRLDQEVGGRTFAMPSPMAGKWPGSGAAAE